MKKAVKIIAIVYSIIATIGIIVCGILLFKGKVLESLLSIVSLVINIILLWAIYVALDRIEILEQKVFAVNDRQQELKSKAIMEDDQQFFHYKKCENCGAIIRTNDLKCPKCNHFYDKK